MRASSCLNTTTVGRATPSRSGSAVALTLSGFPLFFFHGFPSSRLEARGIEDLCRRYNVRCLSPDRPGYGRSTFQPIRMVRWMSKRLPNCKLHEFEGETHFTVMKHLEDIIAKMVENRS